VLATVVVAQQHGGLVVDHERAGEHAQRSDAHEALRHGLMISDAAFTVSAPALTIVRALPLMQTAA
jgi:hypothetical protein